MKKRFNLTWRVVTALLLLVALVPALVVGVATAATPGDTTPPQLVSIGWIDDGPTVPAGKIDVGDHLLFYWSESMQTSILDTMGEVNDYLNSNAEGAPPVAWDYGSSVANPVWNATGTTLSVQLGTDYNTKLSGATVTPKSPIQDKFGNPVSASHVAIVIPPAPDTTTPTLLSATWIDPNRNGLYDTGDQIRYYFSEAIRSTNMLGISYDTLFTLPIPKLFAAGVCLGADFSLPLIGAGAGSTAVTLTLAGTTVTGGESITPVTTGTNAIMDLKGNILGNTTATLPKAGDTTRPTLVSITWIDGGGLPAGTINPGDQLIFKFSESMDTTAMVANAVNTILNPGGHSYGLVADVPVAQSVLWSITDSTLLTVTLGTSETIVGGETVNPVDALLYDKSLNNQDNTTLTVTIPIAPGGASTSAPAKELTPPVLNSVTWNDVNTNGKIDGTDILHFNFNEAMDPTSLNVMGTVCINLDTLATGGSDYGTVGAGAGSMWYRGNTVLEVVLGSDCSTELSGQLVNPSNAVKDAAGNIDATASPAPAIPLVPDVAQPQLMSVTWKDGGAFVGNGIIDVLDYLFFNFNEQMSDIVVGNVNAWLDSSAPGVLDYGGAGLAAVWVPLAEAGSRCQLQVTLGASPSVVLAGQTVNPDVAVSDAKGNPDGTTGSGPAIPLPPDKIAPYLTTIEWQDKDSNNIVNRGDWLVFYFSESVRPASIVTQADINAVLDSTAAGIADYGDIGSELAINWNTASYTSATIVLGLGEDLDGGEMVNPTNGLTDMLMNIDQTPGSGVQIPSLPGTAASLLVSQTSRTFTAAINGSNPDSQTASITNGGTQTLTWTVSSPTQSWLNVAPLSGTGAGTLTFSVNISGLNVSTTPYTDTITVTGAGTSKTVSVSLTITVPATPTPTATPNASSPTATPVPTAVPTATPVPTAVPTPTPGTSGTGTVATTGGTVATADGKVEVTFPAGAFDASTIVTIASASCHGDTDAFVVGNTCFSVTPGGALGAEATICVELSSYDLSLGDESDLTLGYWDGDAWVLASDVTVTGNTICGKTSHLSDWAVLSKTGEGWLWWYWALIGGGAFIVVLAIILLLVLPKRGKGEEIPSEELYGEEEEEF